jgi:uncharacterized protein (DUF2236 family)
MTSSRPNTRKIVKRQREDHGFFGPGSVTWRLWGYPTSLTVGFQRSVVIEELDPFLLAAVVGTNKVRYSPAARYDNTIVYFATMALGDSRAAIEASEILVRVHAKATGIEPVSGRPYSANDPETQLWIHLTAWHSILYVYETFGPGRLSDEDERQYWAECAIAAQLQTCDPADVPRDREGIRQYFDDVRPRLCVTSETQAMMDHLLDAAILVQPRQLVLRPFTTVIGKIMRAATISTFPKWMRKMSGFNQSWPTRLVVRPLVKISARLATPMPSKLRVLKLLSPATLAVVKPALTGEEPINPVVITPAEARAKYGRLASPAELALKEAV